MTSMHDERKESQDSNTSIGAAVALDIKAIDEDGVFEGYASTFGNLDQGNDIAVSGCFRNSLIEVPINKVKLLWQHDPRTVIGKWIEAREDAKGLWVRGRLFLKLIKGAEAYELLKEGAVDGLSIGYRTVEFEWDNDREVRRLKRVELREVSLVTFPMNEQATVSLVKNGTLPTEREFEQFLTRDAGFTRSQAKTIVSSGYKALHVKRDAGNAEQQELLTALNNLTDQIRS